MANDTKLRIGRDWLNTEKDELPPCCVCQSQVVERAWLLTCFHVCCGRCAPGPLNSSGDSESSSSIHSCAEGPPTAQSKTNGTPIACATCKSKSYAMMPAAGDFLKLISIASRSATLRNDHTLATPDQKHDALQLVTKLNLQGSKFFCLTCDAPCDDDDETGDNYACMQQEHDVRATRDPRVTKRLDRLLDDAQRARDRLGGERAELTVVGNTAVQLNTKLCSLQAQYNEDMLEAKRQLTEIIERAHTRATEALQVCFSAYREKAEQAVNDTGSVQKQTDYALQFSDVVIASASASPGLRASLPELLRCFQHQLRPLAEKCRAARDNLAAITMNPELDVYLDRQTPSNVEEVIGNYIGQPTSRSAQILENNKPEVTSHSDIASLRSWRSRIGELSEVNAVPVDRNPNMPLLRKLEDFRLSTPSPDARSQSSRQTPELECENSDSSLSQHNAEQDVPFDQVAGCDSQITRPLLPHRRGHQQQVESANFAQLLAKFESQYKCWDIAIAEDRDAMFVAAYNDGLREFDFKGKELSYWQCESSLANRWHQDSSAATHGSDTVYTLDTLFDDRVVVGLLRASAVAVLKRVSDSLGSPVSDYNSDCGGWIEDGARVPLGSRPWRLSTNGVDLVAVIHASHGPKAQPGSSFDLVSLSIRAVQRHYRLPFPVTSVAFSNDGHLFAASFPTDERRMQFTVVQLNMDCEILRQQTFNDNLFDIACHPSMSDLYMSLGRSRRVVAVSSLDSSQLFELLPYSYDAPVRVSLRKSREVRTVFSILRYDLRKIEVYLI